MNTQDRHERAKAINWYKLNRLARTEACLLLRGAAQLLFVANFGLHKNQLQSSNISAEENGRPRSVLDVCTEILKDRTDCLSHKYAPVLGGEKAKEFFSQKVQKEMASVGEYDVTMLCQLLAGTNLLCNPMAEPEERKQAAEHIKEAVFGRGGLLKIVGRLNHNMEVSLEPKDFGDSLQQLRTALDELANGVETFSKFKHKKSANGSKYVICENRDAFAVFRSCREEFDKKWKDVFADNVSMAKVARMLATVERERSLDVNSNMTEQWLNMHAPLRSGENDEQSSATEGIEPEGEGSDSV